MSLSYPIFVLSPRTVQGESLPFLPYTTTRQGWPPPFSTIPVLGAVEGLRSLYGLNKLCKGVLPAIHTFHPYPWPQQISMTIHGLSSGMGDNNGHGGCIRCRGGIARFSMGEMRGRER